MMKSRISEEWSAAVTARAEEFLGMKVSKEFVVGIHKKRKIFKNFDGLIIFVSEDDTITDLPTNQKYCMGILYKDGTVDCMHQIEQKKASEQYKVLKYKDKLSKFMIAEFLLFYINCVYFFAASDQAIEYLLSDFIKAIEIQLTANPSNPRLKLSNKQLVEAYLKSLRNKDDINEKDEWILGKGNGCNVCDERKMLCIHRHSSNSFNIAYYRSAGAS